MADTKLCVHQSFGGTEEDYQVDDALIDRASRKQSQSHVESRERQLAIIGMIGSVFRLPCVFRIRWNCCYKVIAYTYYIFVNFHICVFGFNLVSFWFLSFYRFV